MVKMFLVLALFLFGHTQAQLPTQPVCEDKASNCNLYGANTCTQYKQWAEENCAATCKFCEAPHLPCEDKDVNCDVYDKSTCDNPNYAKWAETTCRYHCRRCTPAELAVKDAQTTTLPPSLCKDKVDCRQYGTTSCSGTYEHWAKINCMEFCGFCKGPPTPPKVCADTIPNCSAYPKETCSNTKYQIWVQDKCPDYCGLCKNSGGGPGTPPVPVHTQGPGPITPGGPDMMTPPPLPGK